jgi:CubicO group peptidase (beta-lactamase class C family)
MNIRRMKLVFPIAALLFIVFFAASGCFRSGQQKNGYGEVIKAVERFIRHEMDIKDLPALSIALVDGRDIIWAEGFGTAVKKGKIPADADTVYRVGSITKSFTAVAVMQLVESGLLDLDIPIAEYLPELKLCL